MNRLISNANIKYNTWREYTITIYDKTKNIHQNKLNFNSMKAEYQLTDALV